MRFLLLLLSLVALAVVGLLFWHGEGTPLTPDRPVLADPTLPRPQAEAKLETDTQDRIAEKDSIADTLLIRVLRVDGSVPESATIHIFPWSGENRRKIAPRGRVFLPRDGSGFAIAALAEGMWSKPMQMDSTERNGRDELVLALEIPAGSLRVSVVDPIGLSVPNFTVDLEWAGPLPGIAPSSLSVGGLLRKGISNPSSGFFSDLPPGNWTATVHVPTFPDRVASATVESGQAASLRVQLQAGGKIHGIVRDTSGQALAEAQVFLLAEAYASFAPFLPTDALESLAPSGGLARTDEHGFFSLGPLDAGTWHLSVVAKGYSSLQVPAIKILNQESQDMGILQLKPGGDVHFLLLRREEQTPVEGVIAEWQVSDGTSWLNSILPGNELERKSNAEGRLTLPDLPAGEVRVRLAIPGLAPHLWTGDPSLTESLQTILLDPALAIRGRVVEAGNGQPIANARVSASLQAGGFFDGLLSQAGNRSRDSSQSNEEGVFVIPDLAAGEWVLQTQAEGWAPDVSAGILLQNGEENAPVEVRLLQGAEVRVLVLDEDGVPEEGAIVTAMNYGISGSLVTEQADEEGLVVLKHLPTGTWQLTAISENMATQALSAISGSFAGLETRSTYVLAEEGGRHELTLGGLIPRALLQGFVTRGEELVEGMTVLLTGSSGMKSTRTDDIGFYEIEDVPVGNWMMMVGNFGMMGGSGWIGSLDIESSGLIEKNIELPSGSILVRVLAAESGSPLANINVALRPAMGTSGGGWLPTDAQGEALFETLLEGEYVVSVGYLAMPLFGNAGGRGAAIAGPFHFDGTSRLEKQLRLGLSCGLDLRVTDGGGAPIAGVHIFLLHADGQPFHQISTQETDSQGNLRMDGLPAGSFRVLARHASGQVETAVQLTEGVTSSLNLSLDRGCTLRLQITDQAGLPLRGIQAVALDSRGSPISALYSLDHAMSLGMSFFQGGEQILGPLAPGSYTLLLSDFSGQSTRTPLEIPAGRSELVLTLRFLPEP